MLKKLCLVCVLFASVGIQARRHKKMQGGICSTREECESNSNCQCYCSVKCGYRETRPDDSRVWSDEHGMCFCKQWDLEHYENCLGQ